MIEITTTCPYCGNRTDLTLESVITGPFRAYLDGARIKARLDLSDHAILAEDTKLIYCPVCDALFPPSAMDPQICQKGDTL